MTRPFAFMFLAILLFGCATTSAIIKTCEPAKLDEQQAITNLFARPDLDEAEVIATAEGGKIAICVVTEIARDLLNRAKPNELALSLSPTSPSPLMTHAAAWLRVHP